MRMVPDGGQPDAAPFSANDALVDLSFMVSARLTRLPPPTSTNLNDDLSEADVRTLHADAVMCVQMMARLDIDHPKLKQARQYTAGLVSTFSLMQRVIVLSQPICMPRLTDLHAWLLPDMSGVWGATPTSSSLHTLIAPLCRPGVLDGPVRLSGDA